MFDLAIYYRMVGGFIGTGSTQLGRIRFAVAIGCYMALLSLVHHEGWAQAALVLAASTLGAFLGRLIPHAIFQASASLFNSLGMAVINMARLFLIVAPYSVTHLLTFSGFDPWRLILVLFGIGSGIGYFIGWKYLDGKDCGIYFRNTHAQWAIPLPPSGIPVNPPNCLDQCAVGGGEWGELLTGWLAYELMFVFALVLA